MVNIDDEIRERVVGLRSTVGLYEAKRSATREVLKEKAEEAATVDDLKEVIKWLIKTTL